MAAFDKISLDFKPNRKGSFFPKSLQDEAGSLQCLMTQGDSSKLIGCVDTNSLFYFLQRQTPLEKHPVKKFCTGSKYLGQWSRLGISGKGIYKFPHGVIYDGYFNKEGEFHGSGTLTYPSGQMLEGVWKKGKLVRSGFVTKTGVTTNEGYCTMPDRRFQIEQEKNFNPAGQEYLTNEPPPPRALPKKCYDLVDGYYDPKVKTVYAFKTRHRSLPGSSSPGSSSENLHKQLGSECSFIKLLCTSQNDDVGNDVLWIPSAAQEDWIEQHCRRSWDVATGYRPDLYEQWTKGNDCEGGPQEAVNRSEDENRVMLEERLGSKKAESKLKSFIQYPAEMLKS